ncbi:hypothetical protein ACTWQF_13305 [Streptomyces sp. 8N114]|uniref:hypothetical protein n=1 Tax=Streptomyces sp. 8N114 TaxID=3457419 RepID=UPI003FD09080
MTRRSRVVVGAVAVICALVSVGLVVLVVVRDLNTAGQAAGIVGCVASLAAFVLSLHALYRSPATPPSGTRAGAGARTAPHSVTAAGSIGRAVTGNDNRLPGPAPSPPVPPVVPPGNSGSGQTGAAPTSGPRSAPHAAGERGVSAGGDIGEAVTGDGNTVE